MSPPTIGGGAIMYSGLPSVRRPSTPISHDAISLYLVDGFQWNLPQMFTMRVRIAEKVFKVRGQRSKVKVMSRPSTVMEEACISTVWCRGLSFLNLVGDTLLTVLVAF